MSQAVEALERAEKIEHTGHASHGGGHGGHGDSHAKTNKLIGLTMGLIGVLIALCAAMVGGERNEMSRAMIEQTQATADATSASTKFRVIMVDIEHIRAQALETVPKQLKERFVRLYDDYSKERAISGAWASSYQPLVDEHFESAEQFEHAQLIAEVAIVFASLAVLLGNRAAWYVSIALSVGSISVLGYTYFHSQSKLAGIEEKIEKNHEAYTDLRKAHTGDHADEDAVAALDPDGAIRMAIAKAAKEASHAEAVPAKGGESTEKPATRPAG